MSDWNRRSFIKTSAMSSVALSILPGLSIHLMEEDDTVKKRFKISLAQWSLHRSIQSRQLDHLDFAKKAADAFDIYAVEYVNQFFKDKANDAKYLSAMNTRADDAGVTQLLIMIDGEGELADPNDLKRNEAILNHYKWVDAAKILGCHSIRVNAFGSTGDASVLHTSAVDGLSRLATYAAPKGYQCNSGKSWRT
jgi:hypothetical protein